jgi:hypothetical protein
VRAKIWLALCLIPALMATSCIYLIGVQVEPGAAAGEPPAFAFSHHGVPLARLDSFSVSGCPERTSYDAPYTQWEHPELPVLWRIVRDHNAPATAEAPRIRYGQVPAGYVERKPAEPLRPGGCYNVYVAGPGNAPETWPNFGGQTFHLLPDGRLLAGTPSGYLGNSRPFREINRAGVACVRGYRHARTPADSAAIDARAFSVMDTPLTCGWLRGNWPDLMNDTQSAEQIAAVLLFTTAAVLAGIYDSVRN